LISHSTASIILYANFLTVTNQFSPANSLIYVLMKKTGSAVAAFYNDSLKKNSISLIDSEKDPHFFPVTNSSGQVAEPDFNVFTLSPSGKRLFFTSNSKSHGEEGCLLLFVNKIPGGYFQLFSPGRNIDFKKVRWITNPEGLPVYTGKGFLYWNLDGFDVSKIK
jgi:hypothetical protein